MRPAYETLEGDNEALVSPPEDVPLRSPQFSLSAARRHWPLIALGGIVLVIVIYAAHLSFGGPSVYPNGSDGGFLPPDGGILDGGLQAPPSEPQPRDFDQQGGFWNLWVGRKASAAEGQIRFEIPEEDIWPVRGDPRYESGGNLPAPFLVSVVYSRADGELVLLHDGAETAEQNWFAFRKMEFFEGEDDTMCVLELIRPQLSIRVEGDTLSKAWAEGVSAALLGRIPCSEGISSDGSSKVYVINPAKWIQRRLFMVDYPAVVATEDAVRTVTGYKDNIRIEMDENVEISGPPDFGGGSLVGSFRLEFSIIRLPRTPMKARKADNRIGYFTMNYDLLDGDPNSPTSTVELISRWDFERRGVLKYYIDPSVPEDLRPFMKRGVEGWAPAFAAAGIGNKDEPAIRGVMPGDPDWPEDYAAGDVRYPSLTWSPSMKETFARGPSILDPRSGETIHAAIIFAHSWIRAWTLEKDRFVSRTSVDADRKTASSKSKTFRGLRQNQVDVRQDSLGMQYLEGRQRNSRKGVDLEFVGAALVDTVMHEVGHTLGLRHNFRASASFSLAQLQDDAFVQKNGFSSSVMDYLPLPVFPKSANQTTFFSPVVGKYDLAAIRYGYSTNQTEESLLKIAAKTVADGFHFGTDDDQPSPNGLDPYISVWDLSSEPIAYNRMMVELARNHIPQLFDRVKESDSDWHEFYRESSTLWSMAARSLQLTAKFVGGESVLKVRGDKSPRKLLIDEHHAAIDLLTKELDVEQGIFGATLMKKYGQYLVDYDEACSPGLGSCLAEPGIDVLGYLRKLRERALVVLLQPKRMRTIQAKAARAALDDDSSGDGTDIGLATVLQKVSDLFLRESDSRGVQYLLDDAAAQWVELLVESAKVTDPLTLVQLLIELDEYDGPGSAYNLIHAILVGEIRRVSVILEAKVKSNKTNSRSVLLDGLWQQTINYSGG